MAHVSALRDPHFVSALEGYDPRHWFCELLGRNKQPGKLLAPLWHALETSELAELRQRAADAERELFKLGITFTIYSDKDAVDRTLPVDVIPRVVTAEDWSKIEAGVTQRVRALNLFLRDVYHDRKILKDGVIPAELVIGNPCYCEQMAGLDLPHGTYIHVSGTDIVRDRNGEFLVLEDNGRSPSGVSYVVENRHLMQRAFPELMNGLKVRPVSDYGQRLLGKLREVAPAHVDTPSVVLLSPGGYNSAYFEHVFLAREMGIPLVEGRDLFVEDDEVYARTIGGSARVDVIYRRINDEYLDPMVFEPTSMLGVPGLMGAVRKGNVTLANAIGTGIADDKAVYAYVPRIIRYYLDEDPILANVETYLCREKDGLAVTRANLDKLVLKPVGESGGYGIVIGPKASKDQLEAAAARLEAHPENFISQPMIELSVVPTLFDGGARPRHVDLRPFAVTGRDIWVLPGGLTRVALPEGSMVVNSSQGGGTKDTWVLEEDAS